MQATLREDKLAPWNNFRPEVSIPENSDNGATRPGPGVPPKWVDIASRGSTAYTVLALGIVLSAAAGYWTADQVQRDVRLKFQSAATDAHAGIESRIRAHSDVLLGLRGLYIASAEVDRSEFRDYIDSLELGHRYPGIEAVSYAQRITAAQKPAFEAAVRNDTSVNPRGYPNFAVKPAGDRPEYVVVQYLEPMAGREAGLGLDLAGDTVRLAALERARDSGQIAATGSITLALDPRRPTGFAMRLPIYRKGMPLGTVAQRREAFAGVVATVFIVVDLMRGVLKAPFLQTMHLRIDDAGFVDSARGPQPAAADDLLFDSDQLLPAQSAAQAAGDGERAALSSMSSLEVGGRRWNLHFSARPEFASFFNRWLPSAVMLGGAIISLLLFGLIRSLARVGRRAVALAASITADLRRSEASLAEAQRTTQELVEALPNPIFFKRTDGRYLGVNKAWERYFGVAREAFLGRTVHDLYPNNPEIAQRLREQDQVLWDHPGTQMYETSITTPDGKQHDAIYYKATLTRADGGVAGLIGTIIDITDRKRAEQALRESELRFRSLTEMSSDFYWESDAGHRLTQRTSADKRSSTASVFQQGVQLGERRWEIPCLSPDEAGWRAHRAVLDAHLPFRDFELSRLGADGTERHISISGDPVFDASGAFKGYRGVGTDITERKRAAQALAQSEARYRSVIAAMTEGVLVRDRNAGIIACNASAERILGRTLEQMRGSNYMDPDWEWFREDGSPVPPDRRPVNMALRTGQTQSNEVVGLRKGDGSVLWLSMNAQPLFEESDSMPTGVVATIADITQRKQAEQRQAMEHGVTRLLSESESEEIVMPKVIQTVCEALGFACGARMLRDAQAPALRCAETWSVASAGVAQFIQTARPPIHPDDTAGGLLRRVWASGEPVWIADVLADAGFRRGPLAAKAGLRVALAFPIVVGNEILGVMEFFGRTSRAPDAVLLRSLRSIGAQIGQFMARRQAEGRVHHLAHYDELTQLPNRSMFNQRLAHALAQARRNVQPLAVLFIDLDRFKNINDTLGHEAGDRVLKEVAQRLHACLREGDTIGRLGGDEFVVLIEELPEPLHVAAVAQKILAAVVKPIIVGAQEFNIAASIGISTYPGDSEDMQSLLKNADIAMYRAKEQGNNYQFYSALMNIHTVERLALESGLRRALERGEFVLHYQPKVDIVSGRITGMEALLRWQRPGQGLIQPLEFIPLAEETGLIVPIGEWVLRAACVQNKSWQKQSLPPLRIAVNLSARQFAHASLLQDVARVLNETGLDPAALEFEITESMVMHDPEHAVKLLGRLKQMGIHLSIDDFGTGYSSLSYLKRFPIDSLKIDRSFIRDIPGDADDAAITRAIIAMAHSLRLKVIAEGVETAEQLSFLREHGCDEMQGYHFSEPLPEDEFLRLLQGKLQISGSE